MPLYVGDYLADTTHLSCTEQGAYMLLLMCMWRSGGSLPDDDAKLAKITRCTRVQWDRMRPTLIEFFDVEDGLISQGRLSRELTRHASAVEQRRMAGSNGGKAKSLKDKDTALAVATISPCQPEPEPEPKKETDAKASVVVSAEPKPTRDDVRLAFDEWNDLAARLGLPTARKLDDARRKAIRTRLNDGGLEGWREALAAVAASDHCRGDNDRSWKADLDFVCTAAKYRRLREGSYGAPTPPAKPDHARHVPMPATVSLADLKARLDDQLGPPQ